MDGVPVKIKKTYNVFGRKIKVKFVVLNDNIAGMYDDAPGVIYINKYLAQKGFEEQLQDTLIHELGHALFYRVSIDQAIGWQVHEYIVNNMAVMLRELGLVKL
jgi:Zn-dependent peptidase ImmA (M78 family)